MSLTRSQIISAARDNHAGRLDLTDARFLLHLNFVLEHVAGIRSWRNLTRWDEKTICQIASRYAAVPGTLRELINLIIEYGTLSRTLEIIDPDVYDHRHPHPEDDGNQQPTDVCWRGKNFEFYPIPEQAYHCKVYGVYWPDDFDLADDDVCPIEHAESALIYGTTSLMYESLGDVERASYWESKFGKALRRAAARDGGADGKTIQYAGESLRLRYKMTNRLTPVIV